MADTIPNVTKVLLFSGAGLSHPLGLPTSNGFDEIIEPEDNELIRLLKSHLDSRFGDIEAVLSSIEELNSTDNLIYKHLLQNQSNGYFNSVKQNIDSLRNMSRLYTIELKKAVHRKLATPNIPQCESLYYNILKEIRITIPNSAISFFTTNYDLTFEDSIGDNKILQTDLQINEIDDGFILSGSLIFSITKEYDWNPSVLEYKKIHGSLGWYYDARKRTTKSHAGSTPDDPDSVPILYPGFKGSPQNEPFLSLHRQFWQRLLDADYAIFMGFAFRDPYINSLIDMVLMTNHKLKMFCYNPSEIDKLPQESYIHQLIKKEPKRFTYIKKGIGIIDNPLNLKDNLKK